MYCILFCYVVFATKERFTNDNFSFNKPHSFDERSAGFERDEFFDYSATILYTWIYLL